MTDTPRNENSQIRTETETSNTPAHRRRFLQVTAGSIALGLAGCSGGNGGDGSDKIPKNKVNYQDQPRNGEQCSNCKYFIASGYGNDAGKCQKVKGKISNDGWCSLFIEG